MSFLTLDHLQKSFGATKVVQDFDLHVEKGEFISFLGPSGCGKSTTGRCVLRLIEPTAGQVLFEGRDVGAMGPQELRGLARREVAEDHADQRRKSEGDGVDADVEQERHLQHRRQRPAGDQGQQQAQLPATRGLVQRHG